VQKCIVIAADDPTEFHAIRSFLAKIPFIT